MTLSEYLREEFKSSPVYITPIGILVEATVLALNNGTFKVFAQSNNGYPIEYFYNVTNAEYGITLREYLEQKLLDVPIIGTDCCFIRGIEVIYFNDTGFKASIGRPLKDITQYCNFRRII